jgi:DNA-binding MarR family transcriptional regulator
MAMVEHRTRVPADLSGAVHDASARLGLLWVESYSGAGHRVSPSQLRALMAIQQHGGTNLTALAAELGAILSSASRLCDRLVAAGLVERTQGAGDRREVAMSLTRQGEELLTAIERERRSAMNAVLEQMSPQEQSELLHGLQAFSLVGQPPVQASQRRTS